MINVTEVLDKLEAINYIDQVRKTGQWMQIRCPFHGDGHERKPSCGVLLEDQYRNGDMWHAGSCHCFACGYSGSLQKWVSDLFNLKGSSNSGIEWLTRNIDGFESSQGTISSLVPDNLMGNVIAKYAADSLHARFSAKQNYVSEEELTKYRYTVPYMYQRKLTDAVIDKYDVGYDGQWVPPGRKKPCPCITFPVRDIKGNTLFLCRRSIEGKLFNYPEGVTKPVYGIYELPKDCKSVIICESCFNALTCAVYGFNAVALLGTGNTYQLTQLQRMGVREFIVCLDNDEAGKRGTAKLKAALSSSAFVWTMHVPEGKDVNDLSYNEFIECYNARE